MKRWLAIIAVVGITVALLAVRHGCRATGERERSASSATRDRSPAVSLVMPNRNSEPAGSLHLAGHVVGPSGQKIAGARVWIDSLPPRATTSARDGAFEFENLIGRTYEVRALAGDLVGGPQVIRLVDQDTPMVIKLREGAYVLVTVVDATRTPIANALIRVVGDDSTTATDAKGQARITAHPGWVAVEATGRGYAPRRVSVTSASSGTTSPITIVLHEGFEVSGHVLDQDRHPIPNARIYGTRSRGGLRSGDQRRSLATA